MAIQCTFLEQLPPEEWGEGVDIWREPSSTSNQHIADVVRQEAQNSCQRFSFPQGFPELELVVVLLEEESLENPLLYQYAFSHPKHFHGKPVLSIALQKLDFGEETKNFHERGRFWDSSIWHRSLSIREAAEFQIPPSIPKAKKIRKRLHGLLDQLLHYHTQGLYHTVVGREFVDYQRRKVANAYYSLEYEGHSEEVSPYYWHSEQELKLQADQLQADLKGLQWEALLADDFAVKPLRSVVDTPSLQKIVPSKWKLIYDLINGTGQVLLKLYPPMRTAEVTDMMADQQMVPDFPQMEEETFKRRPLTVMLGFLQLNQQIDLVFVDHYHGRESEADEKYGYQLLQKLQHLLKEDRPLLETYWIFPVSAFDEAFRSLLRVAGLGHRSDQLNIDNGADPINTPELFRYRMYRFLELYFQTTGLGLKDFFEESLKILKNLQPVSEQELREALLSYYPSIVHLNIKLQLLKKAQETTENSPPSLFATTYLKDIGSLQNTSDLCINIQELTHLLIYGTRLQWPKMWEIAQFLEDLVEEMNPSSSVLQDLKANGKALLQQVKAYIGTLREVPNPSSH